MKEPENAPNGPDVGASPEELAFIARVLNDRARALRLRRRVILAGTTLVVTLALLVTAHGVPQWPARAPASSTVAAIPPVPESAAQVASTAEPTMEAVPSRVPRDRVEAGGPRKRAVTATRDAKRVARPKHATASGGRVSVRGVKAGDSLASIRPRSLVEAP